MIETHAHLTHIRFKEFFRYLSYSCERDTYDIHEGMLADMMTEMENAGITEMIEPAISYESNKRILAFCEMHPHVYPALGIHPKRIYKYREEKEKRLSLRKAIPFCRLIGKNRHRIVAIGETGLDFSVDTPHRFRQYFWFVLQIFIAHHYRLPLILHIREANKEGLKILTHFQKKLHGGIAHCFNGTVEDAKKFTELGFCLGIGGFLLQEQQSSTLEEVIRKIPLEFLVVETDSPYVSPDFSCDLSTRAKSNVRNTPLILPKIILQIAELKGISAEEAERVITKTSKSIFRLDSMDLRKSNI